jgi:hypothetical protein
MAAALAAAWLGPWNVKADTNAADRPVVGAWMSPMYAMWRKSYGKNSFPAEKIARDLSDAGITDIFFFIQGRRGGPFAYRTKLPHAAVENMPGDSLEDLLTAADRCGQRVWLTYSPPAGPYPGTDMKGFNDPRMIAFYCDVIEEVARNYGRHSSLAGFHAHECNACEQADNHEEEREEFAEFCRQRFGERFEGEPYPPRTDAGDKWWRRFYLYKNNSLNTFMARTAEAARRHGLKTLFCMYQPEVGGSGSWRWGYDALALEKICDSIWIYGAGDFAKTYQRMNGLFVDIALTYSGAAYPRHFGFAFHGQPISFFEYSAPLYPVEMRRFYANTNWAKTHGDYYLEYKGYTEKLMQLFVGKANVTRWMSLLASWQGGESPARVAIATTSAPFIMRDPDATQSEYKRHVLDMFQKLAFRLDLDGLLLGSQWTLNPRHLVRYRLIVLAEHMGEGLAPETAGSLREYVRLGGKLLIMASPLVQTRTDLTDPQDLTEEFCGLTVSAEPRAGARVTPVATDGLTVGSNTFWVSGVRDVALREGTAVVVDRLTKKPLLVRNGNSFFSAAGFAPEAADYFADLLQTLADPPITLDANGGVRLLETVRKNNAVCVSLFEQGAARLRVDVSDAGLTGRTFEVRNILTGVRLHRGDAASLGAGIPVEIRLPNQPCVLAIGPPESLAPYPGIYPASEDFSGLEAVQPDENPQVPIMVPDKAGAKVGIYHRGLGATEILKALQSETNLNVFTLPRLDASAIGACDVVVIPQSSPAHVSRAGERLRQFVDSGGGLLLTHDAVGYETGAHPLFPTVGQIGIKAIYRSEDRGRHLVRVAISHPISAGFQVGDTFAPGFQFDHYVIDPVEKEGVSTRGVVVIQDDRTNAVVVAGAVGKGRVVLNGMLPGWGGSPENPGGEPRPPTGGELQCLRNTVRWLAGAAQGKPAL